MDRLRSHCRTVVTPRLLRSVIAGIAGLAIRLLASFESMGGVVSDSAWLLRTRSPLPESGWWLLELLAETTGEVERILKADFGGDGSDGEIGLGHQLAGDLEAKVLAEALRRGSDLGFEDVAQP